MTVRIEEIQPGWLVVDAHGDEVGTVIENSGETVRVKKGGLLGGEVTISRDVVREFETGRVELNRTRDELSAR
jgi:hypothetical protein